MLFSPKFFDTMKCQEIVQRVALIHEIEYKRPCVGKPLCITLYYGYWALIGTAGYSLMGQLAGGDLVF